MSPRMEDTPEDLLKQDGKQSLIREVLDLRAQVETLTAERDNLVLGLNSIVHCKSGVTRPALREAAAEVLGRRVERWSEDQSPFATLAHEANARALASDTARASAEAALAEALTALQACVDQLEQDTHMLYAEYAQSAQTTEAEKLARAVLARSASPKPGSGA